MPTQDSGVASSRTIAASLAASGCKAAGCADGRRRSYQACAALSFRSRTDRAHARRHNHSAVACKQPGCCAGAAGQLVAEALDAKLQVQAAWALKVLSQVVNAGLGTSHLHCREAVGELPRPTQVGACYKTGGATVTGTAKDLSQAGTRSFGFEPKRMRKLFSRRSVTGPVS
ncbi:unnamed protein product [Symbiodinium sp. CCMP2592]|nr:unnamed protein product [Symbiodinium sp. CCMP2592]